MAEEKKGLESQRDTLVNAVTKVFAEELGVDYKPDDAWKLTEALVRNGAVIIPANEYKQLKTPPPINFEQ